MFLLEAPERAVRIELSLEVLDRAETPAGRRAAGTAAARQAHNLFGAAATVGLDELARLADELEVTLRDGLAKRDPAELVAEARTRLDAIKATIADLERESPPPAGEGADQRTLTVLHVEDNPLNARLVERVLARRPGVRLLAATHGQSALRLARERQPGLILLDLNLPDMSGIEVLDRLRQDPETRGLAVVVVTAHEPARTSHRLRDFGIREYLPKPIDVGRLLEVVDEIGRG